MKSLFMTVLLAAAPAMAMIDGNQEQDQSSVDYVSWCDNNNVIGQNSEGELELRANCTDAGLTCKTTQIYRLRRSIVSASCVKN